MIMKQIHFVHVEDPAMGRSQEAGLVTDLSGSQGLAQIKRANHPIFRGSDRELDQPGRASLRYGMIMRTGRACRVRVQRVATEAAAFDNADAWHHIGER